MYSVNITKKTESLVKNLINTELLQQNNHISGTDYIFANIIRSRAERPYVHYYLI